MGSDFVSISEAAKMLNRSKRAVGGYLKNGVLTKHYDGRTVAIPRAEVETLAIDIGSHMPAMNRKTFFQLVSRVQRLEAASAVLQKVTGLGAAPMRPSKAESSGLYDAARKAVGAKVWGLDEINAWVDLYERMDEVFFDIVSAHVAVSDPWRPFFELCIAQAKQVSQQQGFSTNLGLQQLHDRLRSSMKTMRGVVLAWIEVGGGSAEASVDPHQDLLRRLAAKRSSSLG